MGITHLFENAHFTYKILQYTGFNCTCYTCSYDKCEWDMSQYNKLSNIQYARFRYFVSTFILDCFGQLVSPQYMTCCYQYSFSLLSWHFWCNISEELISQGSGRLICQGVLTILGGVLKFFSKGGGEVFFARCQPIFQDPPPCLIKRPLPNRAQMYMLPLLWSNTMYINVKPIKGWGHCELYGLS